MRNQGRAGVEEGKAYSNWQAGKADGPAIPGSLPSSPFFAPTRTALCRM